MTSPDAMRASDSDRERVVQALQEQVGEGRLTLGEFEERSAAVYQAKTVGDLRKLLADLPVDVFAQPAPPPFGMGMGGMGSPWQRPFPMSPIPPWQQQRRPVVRGGRPSPVFFIILAFLAFALIGEGIVVSIPYIIPLVFIGFLVLRLTLLSRRGGRRHPPYR